MLMLSVLFFAMTTLFAFPYYGTKCFGYVFGNKRKHIYNYLYLAGIFIAAVSSLKVIISLIDGVYALMAIPTMISALLLSPRVRREANRYFQSLKNN